MVLSEAQEDYLKQIFILGEGRQKVGTQTLAHRLEVRPASVTEMVGRLAQLGLVEHARYRGVSLTDSGRRVALEMLRHHRLLETFLVEVLGYEWDQVHEEAERLEHVISERYEARIAEAARIGFKRAFVPAESAGAIAGRKALDIVPVSNIIEALEGCTKEQ